MSETNSIWIKDGLKNLERIRDSYEDRSKMFRMDRNERTWKFSDTILNEIVQQIDSDILTNYTEIEGTYKKIADYLGVKFEQVYLHSGSDLVIKSVFETYVNKGDKVLIQKPSYAMYGVYARMYEADYHEQAVDMSLHFDLPSYCRRIEELKPKLVILENPGGYIGNSFSHAEVKEFVETAHKNGALAVVDEAYIDYIPESSVLDLIDQYDNLIVIRTFSKAWGLAGLRAGYAVSNEILISELFKVRPMHELTSFTALVVEILLSHLDDIWSYVDEVIKVRTFFCNELEKMGFRYAKSDTHFVTVCLGEKLDLDNFRIRAHESGFYVRRPFGETLLKDWVRMGLLPQYEMEEFVDFLKAYCGNSGECVN